MKRARNEKESNVKIVETVHLFSLPVDVLCTKIGLYILPITPTTFSITFWRDFFRYFSTCKRIYEQTKDTLETIINILKTEKKFIITTATKKISIFIKRVVDATRNLFACMNVFKQSMKDTLFNSYQEEFRALYEEDKKRHLIIPDLDTLWNFNIRLRVPTVPDHRASRSLQRNLLVFINDTGKDIDTKSNILLTSEFKRHLYRNCTSNEYRIIRDSLKELNEFKSNGVDQDYADKHNNSEYFVIPTSTFGFQYVLPRLYYFWLQDVLVDIGKNRPDIIVKTHLLNN
jgi:hypothetical protein